MGSQLDLVAELDYPMFIATVAAAGGQRAGALIGFATQCRIHPPRFLDGISLKHRTHRVAMGAESMAMHLVPEDATELAELFGGQTATRWTSSSAARGGPARTACRCSDDCPKAAFTWEHPRARGLEDYNGMVAGKFLAEVEGRDGQLNFHAEALRPRARSLRFSG